MRPGAAELTSLAVELARDAGTRARTRRRESLAGSIVGSVGASLDVVAKSTPTDLVTLVDRDVESWLGATIAARRPDDGVLGEEGLSRQGSSGVRWIVDPIDGTVNFVLGLPAWCVSVAAEVDGVVCAGAVYNPSTDELFRAELGGGAYLGEHRLNGPRDVALDRAVIGTGFGYDASVRAAQGVVVARLLGRVADIRRIGSSALDLCSVGAGRLDAYYEAGLNPWDRAAGLLVATEAGCLASGLRGRAPDGRLTAVAHPSMSAQLWRVLEDLNADGVLDSR